MLGASVTVVLMRRCGQGSTDKHSHPFPAEGGHEIYDDTRDEQEKQWFEDSRAYSGDGYETDSNGALSPNPKQVPQISAPTNYGSLRLSRRYRAVAHHDVPISESFYDDAVAESRALELNLSSDEEPPSPHAQLRTGSIRRILLQHIESEMNQTPRDYVPLRIRSTRSTAQPNVSTQVNHPSITSPLQLAVSPRQMHDLFFVDYATAPQNQWVTAEKLLGDQNAEDENSDEDYMVKRAVLLAGIDPGVERMKTKPPLTQPKAIPTSISALSTTAVPRRLVKSRPWRSSSQAERELFIRDQVDWELEEELPDTPSAPSGYGRVANIVNTAWSQRATVPAQTSPTSFESSLGSYNDPPVNQERAIRFGLAADGIEHRLGFLP